MKRAAVIIFSWIVAVSLTLYGPIGMAAASDSGASFSMEICADGVSLTVQVDASGSPVEPSHDCQECLACGHAMVGTPLDANSVYVAHSPMVSAAGLTQFDALYIQTDNIRPMPRGPPVGNIAMKAIPDLIKIDHAGDGHNTHGDGRPPFKDASA